MTNKITNLEQFREWASRAFNKSYESFNWNFADGKYVKLFDGEPNEDNFWMWRDFLRMYRNPVTGKPEWLSPVWLGNIELNDETRLHFAHVSVTDSTMVSYTPDAAKGKRDIRVKIKPGKYLQQFYPTLGASDVRMWADKHRDLYALDDIKFACTPAEVLDVYMKGPSSCMKKHDEDYACKGINPVEVYGYSPTCVVAYIDRGKGSYSGRVVCDIGTNPPRFGRIYGDETVLKAKLERMGFVHAPHGLEGMEIAKVEDDLGRAVMPYIDWTPYVVEHPDGRMFLTRSSTSSAGKVYSAQSTEGFLQKNYTCPVCGRDHSAVNMTRFRRYNTDTHQDETVFGCVSCRDKIADVIVDETGEFRRVPMNTRTMRYVRGVGHMLNDISPESLGYVLDPATNRYSRSERAAA